MQKLIEARGDLTQFEAATALGITLTSLQAYEEGRRIPRDEIKARMAHFYGVAVADLFPACEK